MNLKLSLNRNRLISNAGKIFGIPELFFLFNLTFYKDALQADINQYCLGCCQTYPYNDLYQLHFERLADLLFETGLLYPLIVYTAQLTYLTLSLLAAEISNYKNLMEI